MALPGERPRYHLQSIQRRHFETLAKKLGLTVHADALIDEMIAATPAAIGAVTAMLPKGFPQALTDRVFGGLAKSAKTLAGANVN
jgi:serine/threonine-protein kinase HipA